MIETTKDLHDRFNSYSSYTQSDEITLYLPVLKDKRTNENLEHQFNGRTQKLVSLASAYATVCFNKHLRILVKKYETTLELKYPNKNAFEYLSKIVDKLDLAYFDARVFGVPDKAEVFNSFMFRSRDNEKNSKSQFAQAHCNHKELLHKNGAEQIQYTLEKTGKDWNTIEDKYKYGTLVKKELYIKETESGNVQRSRTKRIYQKFTEFSEENVKLICSQYLSSL